MDLILWNNHKPSRVFSSFSGGESRIIFQTPEAARPREAQQTETPEQKVETRTPEQIAKDGQNAQARKERNTERAQKEKTDRVGEQAMLAGLEEQMRNQPDSRPSVIAPEKKAEPPRTLEQEKKSEARMTPEAVKKFWEKNSALEHAVRLARDEEEDVSRPLELGQDTPDKYRALMQLTRMLQIQRDHLESGVGVLPPEERDKLRHTIGTVDSLLEMDRIIIRDIGDKHPEWLLSELQRKKPQTPEQMEGRDKNRRLYQALKNTMEKFIQDREKDAKKCEDQLRSYGSLRRVGDFLGNVVNVLETGSSQRTARDIIVRDKEEVQRILEESRQILQKLDSAYAIQDIREQNAALYTVRSEAGRIDIELSHKLPY